MTEPVNKASDESRSERSGPTERQWESVITGVNMGLLVVTVGCAIWGSALSPSVMSAPRVPTTPAVNIDWLKPEPSALSITASLVELHGDAARLSIVLTGNLHAHASLDWRLSFQHLIGTFCPESKSAITGKPANLGGGEWRISGSSAVTKYSHAVAVDIHVCWTHSSPVSVGGPYFSAALPLVTYGENAVPILRSFSMPGYGLLAYSVQSDTSPTSTDGHSWFWAGVLSQVTGNPSASEIPISGASLTGVQHEDRNAFYSGILLGIAASSAIALLMALLVRWDDAREGRRRRRATRERQASGAPEPGGNGEG